MNIHTPLHEPREIGLLRTDYRPPDPFEALKQSVQSIEVEPPDPLSELAILLAALTYGEMTELAAAIWKMKPDEGELNKETLPATLHRWSKSHA